MPIFSQMLEMLALAIFFLVGGHRQVIDALLGSFAWMPPGQGRLPDELVEALTAVAAQSFEIGIRAAAPVMVACCWRSLIVALISRTLPQLNAVAVGLNFNSLIVLGRVRPSAWAPPAGCFRSRWDGDRRRCASSFDWRAGCVSSA